MHNRYALSAAAVLMLAALFHSLTRLAADSPPKPGTILTVAGNGKVGFSGDGGPATLAALNAPFGMVVDAAGNLFFADGDNDRVRKVSPDGTITTVVGGGTKAPTAAEGGPATQARLGQTLIGLAVDQADNFLVVDNGGCRLWQVSPAGLITTLAGNGKLGFSGDGGPAVKASLHWPTGVALDPRGGVLIVDYYNHRVRRVSPDGTIVTVAGGGNPADGRGDGGPATQARLRYPCDVALDRMGNLFITDILNNRVRMVRPDGIILTVAGGGHPADGLGDGGLATEARLDGVYSVAVDGGGNLFVSDNHHFRVRRIGPAGIITTVAGTGEAGFSGDGGPATEAKLNAPGWLALDRSGNLYIADSVRLTSAQGDYAVSKNNRIREVFGVAVPE